MRLEMTGNGTAVFFPIFIPACGRGIITAMTGPGFTLNVPENFRRTTAMDSGRLGRAIIL